ncbi:CopG family ribbon-helix-helix protein [Trichloromonas acetexigens]|uniref:Ribbon-helix-helix protein, CopG family n=1 Tax=Trichloromonas acetexigens TaxID=38815 RepID=A0A550J7A7_9BACT|nr:CopG family ribbon-helix-helix protein [Desulfuromonas acetexigens]TRO79096.1 ribbon-helix-helix protein, CopG family [Desulfuromonas acetexigens]
MKKQTLVSVRLSDPVAERLENLAHATNRSKSFLAAQAIEEFLALQEWQVAAIKEGIDAADRGELVSHDEAVAELSRWGKSHAD